MLEFNQTFRTLFWSKVKKGSGCWEWQASKTSAGYGQIQARKIHPHPLHAHRVSWELHNGKIPVGAHVLHRCDNPCCVRPGHLFLGTQRSNNEDRQRKGRTASGDQNGARTKPRRNPFVRNKGSGLQGEKHPQAKLTDAQVRKLRRAFSRGTNRKQLAKKYKISETHVYRLGKGQRSCL